MCFGQKSHFQDQLMSLQPSWRDRLAQDLKITLAEISHSEDRTVQSAKGLRFEGMKMK